MKSFLQNRTLTIAITVSVLAHGALLMLRFVPPEVFHFKPADPGLEVILVNAKHDRAPLKADALAQANLDGGGNANAGRAKSPLPDLRRSEDGNSAKSAASRRIAELEERQRLLMARLNSKSQFETPIAKDNPKLRDLPNPTDGLEYLEKQKEIARREAEIAKQVEDYNKRPKKTQITPSTREVGYAAYYKSMQDKIEKIGTLSFPQRNGKKLYGELIVYIPVFQDGSLYEKEGGPRVERSSGNTSLDREALRIVRASAPYGRFPGSMRSTDKDDVWEVVTRFHFTREGALEAELRGGAN